MANIQNRYARMAWGRNHLKAVASGCLSDSTHALVVDVDVLSPLPLPGTADRILDQCRAIISDRTLYAISAGSIPVYYDILALRHLDLVQDDIAQVMERLKRSPIAFHNFMIKFVYPLQHKIPRLAPLRCRSAFGGLTIYRSGDYSRHSYASRPQGRDYDICEHVGFHEAISANGAQVLISNELLVRAPPEHRPRSLFSRLWRRFRIHILRPGPSLEH